MGQELRVVQCYKCNMFQVDIVKKSPKWSCKICGEKQTLRQEFGRGSGKDCRNHVKLLNEKHHQKNGILENLVNSNVKNIDENQFTNQSHFNNPPETSSDSLSSKQQIEGQSKWNNYLNANQKENESEEPIDDKKKNEPSSKRVKMVQSSNENLRQYAQTPNVSTDLMNNKTDDDYSTISQSTKTHLASTSKICGQPSSAEIDHTQQSSIQKPSKWNQFITDNTNQDEVNGP